MTNKQLIEAAKQAMKGLWEVNGGRLLEHEQSAYNCLRLFCERLPERQPCLDCGKVSEVVPAPDQYEGWCYECARSDAMADSDAYDAKTEQMDGEY